MTQTAEKMIDVQDVTVSFDGFKALDGLNFSMKPGELRFLIGPNGAGKSTLLDIITGKTKPVSGKVLFNGGSDMRRWPEYKRVQRGIGRKFQTPTVFGSLTVWENLEAAVGLHDPTYSLLRSLPAGHKTRVSDVLDEIGLKARADVRAGTLAHGEKQWLEIGMLLAQEPKLLLLDEPIAGMTKPEREHTGALLHRMAERRSILVVEHDMDFMRRYARTVTVLHMGQWLCEGSVADVQSDPRVIEVYLGRAREEK